MNKKREILAKEASADMEVAESIAAMEMLAGEPEATMVVDAKASFAFLVGALAGGNIVSSFLRIVGGILQARFVTPSVLGLFNGIGLVLGYAPFLQLGILNGLNRELPYYIGKGDKQHAHDLAGAAQAWALAVGALVGLMLFCVAGWQLVAGEYWLAAGWFTNAIMAVFLFYNNYYLQMTYRTSHDFARLALVGVVENAISLVLVILVALMSFYGLCLRAMLTAALSTALLYYWRPVRIGPSWNIRHLKHLLIIGAPIFGVGQLYSWWVVLNSTLVLQYLGTVGMGLNSLVIVAGATLDLLPLAVTQVVYPRMAEQFGRTGNIHDLLHITWKPIIILATGMIPLIALIWLLVGPVMRIVLPAYIDAVPAIKWGILIPFISSFSPINHVFNVVRRQLLFAIAILLGMGSYICSLMWLIRDNATLIAFSQAMLIGRVVFMIVCYLFVLYLHNKERRHTASGK